MENGRKKEETIQKYKGEIRKLGTKIKFREKVLELDGYEREAIAKRW